MSDREKAPYHLEWNDAMNTGVEAIDKDHKHLLSLIIQLSEAIDANGDKSAIEAVFAELQKYILQHFAREEALMRKCQYHDLAAHIKLHQAFTDTIPQLKEKLLSGQSKQVAEETYLYLFHWLVDHIIGEDMQFSQQAHQHNLGGAPKPQQASLLNKLSLAISHHVALSWRVLMISLFPIIAMIALSLMILSENMQQLNNMKSLQQEFHIIHYASKMNHSLQAERGLSIGHMSSGHEQFSAQLIKQRHQTDQAATQFILQIKTLSDAMLDGHVDTALLSYIEAAKAHLAELNHYREAVDQKPNSINSTMTYYTEFIAILRDLPDSMVHLNMSSDLSNNILALSAMMHLKEAVGLQRAMGARILTGQRILNDDLNSYLQLIRAQHGAKGMFSHTASAEQEQNWLHHQDENINHRIQQLELDFIAMLSNKTPASISSKQWFNVYTKKMDQLLSMSETLLHDLEMNTANKVNALHSKLYISAFILISLILLTLLFSRMLIFSITYPVKRMTLAMTSLAKGNRSIRFNETFAYDELETMATAYEKCRISLLQADLSTTIYMRRQQSDLKRKLNEQHIKSAIQDHALDCIITCDKNFIITDINPSTASLFRLDKKSALGQNLKHMVVGIEQQDLNVHIETDAIRPDQSKFDVETSISSIQTDDFTGYICFIRDISKRKAAESNIQKLSQAIGQAGESILITDRNGIIEYVNAAFTTLTGYLASEAIGQSPNILKSGNQDDAFYKHMWETITNGQTWQHKVVEKRKDGSFFPVILTIAPIINSKGEITHFVGSHADISDLESMEKQFRQAQKMEAVGILVGGIAHDFKQFGYISAIACR